MDMTPQRWTDTSAYLKSVFGASQGATGPIEMRLSTLTERAVAAGLPQISISADVGRLLTVLTVLATRTRESKGRVLEVGTLAGYSGLWMVRGLPTPAGGQLITIEHDPKHAAFAREEFAAAGASDRVELVEGSAMKVLPQLVERLGPGSVDLVFLDAEKREYVDYARAVKPLIRIGGLLVADNALGSGNWWVTEIAGGPQDASELSRRGADRFNRMMASDADFETSCVPIREGVLIAARVR